MKDPANDAPEPEWFLRGQVVYLRPPDIQADIRDGSWHQWFNDPNTTRYLEHGVFPIGRTEEAQFVESEIKNPSSLILAVVALKTHQHIGVISLKSIDLINRNAEIAIVMSQRRVPGAALEAMALLTKHGFDKLNLIKIYAGQHEGLWKWVNTLELIGYKLEGYRRTAGIRFGKSYGAVIMAVCADDFYAIEPACGRAGLIEGLPGLLRTRRKKNMVAELKATIDQLYDE